MHLNRRQFIAATTAFACAPSLDASAQTPAAGEPIIDIHQHTNYHGRSDEKLIAHQRAMGVTTSILLPAGRPVERPSTHNGKSNGLAAKCAGNESVMAVARANLGEFVFGANEVADLPEARAEIEKYLKLGGKIIGEQKFSVECDSSYIEEIARLAQDFGVPVLLHFQHATYNLSFERFHKILEKFPKVNFIGHAQAWWGNIDKNHNPKENYPLGKVTPGGITDRYLTDYPNMFGDLSAGSGINALLRDEEHTRAFFERHQNKLLYGSDCADSIGRGPGCSGARTIEAVRRLAPTKAIERKLLFENSKKLFRL
jgi:predicted TIM-barrel fold metal-dependent hydrolase